MTVQEFLDRVLNSGFDWSVPLNNYKLEFIKIDRFDKGEIRAELKEVLVNKINKTIEFILEG